MKKTKRFIKKNLIWIIITSVLIIIAVAVFYTMPRKPYKEVRIPISSTKQTLQAFIYFPNDNKKHDVVIYNHGATGMYPKNILPSELQATYFMNKGYIVIVPMRKGKGASDGISLESEEKNDDINSWAPGINSAFEDISSVIEYSINLPQFNNDIILAGVSRGGYLSVAYSANGKYKDRIKAVISFVGSWVAQAEDHCPIDFNLVSFTELGKASNVPNIWLYGKHDLFNDESSIVSYYNAFKLSNNNTEFYFYDNVPGNGHFLVDYKDIWEKDLSGFLEKLKG